MGIEDWALGKQEVWEVLEVWEDGQEMQGWEEKEVLEVWEDGQEMQGWEEKGV